MAWAPPTHEGFCLRGAQEGPAACLLDPPNPAPSEPTGRREPGFTFAHFSAGSLQINATSEVGARPKLLPVVTWRSLSGWSRWTPSAVVFGRPPETHPRGYENHPGDSRAPTFAGPDA